MSELESTCWTVIRGASLGDASAREIFARYYEPLVWAYLECRWRGQFSRQEGDDAVQEVFLDCFKLEGAPSRADPERPAGFRAFLFGVTRTAALHFETRGQRQRERRQASESPRDAVAGDEERLSQVYDRAWAEMVLNDALDRQIDAARDLGPEAGRRVASPR